MNFPIRITAFYKFSPVEERELATMKKEFFTFGEENGMRGLVLLATEGINGTVCGIPEVIDMWKKMLTEKFGEIVFKDSGATTLVFARWFVKVRKEIVALRRDGPLNSHHHLSPEEWNAMMEEEDVVILDARNKYETKLGMFRGAVDPNITTFHEFADFVSKSEIPKDKKVMMYCTGGIRCERALVEMEKQGYSNVYQLQGGILAYLEQFPGKQFDGECFVFDHRVSVDQELKPSQKYRTCPHCGDPGDVEISCKHCDETKVICKDCHARDERRTCSKNCRYRLITGVKRKPVAA